MMEVNRALTESAGLQATRGGLAGVERELAGEANLAGRTMLGEKPLVTQQRMVKGGLEDIARKRGGLDTSTADEQAVRLTQSLTQAGRGARERMGLDGGISRWIMPGLWAQSRASATSAIQRATWRK